MKKLCFVLSPIGEPNSPIRRRANGVLDEIIRPAFEPLGYDVERADHDKSPGVVTESIIGKIFSAELVVADLTGHNPNVMYELAIRHAAHRPVIQMLEEGERLPFDVSVQNTIFFDGDLGGRTPAISALVTAHEAILTSPDLGNPVVRALDLRLARDSASDPQKLILDLLSEVRLGVDILLSRPRSKPPFQGWVDMESLTKKEAMKQFFADPRLSQAGITNLGLSPMPTLIEGLGDDAEGRFTVLVKIRDWNSERANELKEDFERLITDMIDQTKRRRFGPRLTSQE